MIRPALALLLCAAPLVGQADETTSAAKLTPTLDLLPKGSTLRDVRIPRYDEDKRPAALLRADLMEVVSKNFVRAEQVELLIFNPDGSPQHQVRMKAANYEVSTGVLEALETITISSEQFRATGQGGIFQLDSRRGFLHGPVTTSFLSRPKETSMTTPSARRPLAALLAGSASLALAVPEPFTPAELAAFEAQTASEAGALLAEVAPTRELTTRADQLSQFATVGLRSFAESLNRAAILTALAPEPVVASEEPPLKPDPAGLYVTCEGGMYFDAENGHVVYLKNVLIKEPRFTMRAGKELKIFLAKKTDLPEGGKGEQDPEGGMKVPSFDAASNFADVKNIIASGGVELIKNNPEGQPVRASAATATYDATTGDVVLRGDFPTVQEGKQFLRAKEAGLYIRVYANGNVYCEPGKWETGLVPAELKNK